MAKHATTPGGSSVPAAARPFSHAPPTKSKCTWDPWTHLTNLCQPTKAGSSVASPGCRRFRSRDDTSAIVTLRVALRSRWSMPPFDIPAAVSGHLSSLHSHDAQPQLAPTLIGHDLVDELHLMAFP